MTFRCPQCGRLWNYDQSFRIIYKVFPPNGFHYEDEQGYILQKCPKCAGTIPIQSFHRSQSFTHTNIHITERSKGFFLHN